MACYPCLPTFTDYMLHYYPDRRWAHKPNCAFSNGNIIAFDFEMAFSFTEIIFGGTADAWRVDRQMSREHLFYRSIKGKVNNWSPFLDNLCRISDDKIKDMCEATLIAWHGTHPGKVAQHITIVRDNAERFRKELELSVS